MANFKAIADLQTIPLRPITLLFGPNSAGKSTVIHSLAFAHEAARTNDLNVSQTQVGGSSIDLGGYSRFVFHRDVARRVQWGGEFIIDEIDSEIAAVLPRGARLGVLLTLGMPVDDLGLPISGSAVSVESYELTVQSLPLLRMSRRADVGLRMDNLNELHPLMERFYSRILNISKPTARVHRDSAVSILDIVGRLSSQLVATNRNLIPAGLMEIDGSTSPGDSWPVVTSRAAQKRHVQARLGLTNFLSRLQGIVSQAFIGVMDNLRYLGPLRSYPSRAFAFEFERDPDWRSGGGYAWDVVRKNERVREQVNRWLSADWLQTRYKLSIRQLVALADLRPNLEELIQLVSGSAVDGEDEVDPEFYAGDFLDMAAVDSGVDQIDELVLTDIGTDTVVSHRDVGIGISQALPVLVSAFAEEHSLIAIEQPEIHLHPALQAELGDVFLTSALGGAGNSFILETHSEHLMLRLLRRIRETTEGQLPENIPQVRPEDLSVLYISPTERGSVIQQIEVTNDGEFETPWPRGFFGERAKELF